MNRFAQFTLFALSSALVIAPPAFANTSLEEPTSVRVPYRDLDVTNPAGAETLMARISQAADDACGGRPDTREIEAMTRYRACKHDAVARAVDQLQIPELTALYDKTVKLASAE